MFDIKRAWGERRWPPFISTTFAPQRGPSPPFSRSQFRTSSVGYEALGDHVEPCTEVSLVPPPCINPQSTHPSESRITVLAGMGCFWLVLHRWPREPNASILARQGGAEIRWTALQTVARSHQHAHNPPRQHSVAASDHPQPLIGGCLSGLQLYAARQIAR